MHLDDLDIPLRPERGGSTLHQRREHVDAEAEIAGADNDRMPRREAELADIGLAHAGGADNMHQPGLRRERREFHRCRRGGEIEHALRFHEGFERIGR